MQINKKPKKILALDQALVQSGYAVFDSEKNLLDYGIITPNKGDVGVQRFCSVRDKIKQLYIKHQPTIAVLEPPLGDDPKSRQTDERGIITFSILNGTYWMNRMIAYDFGCEEVDIPASVWQNRIGAFTNDRKLRKVKAREFAMKEFNLPGDLAQDIYDAVVIGWTYFYHQSFKPGTVSWAKEATRKETIEDREKKSAF